MVQAAATLREPHRVARYLEETAASYHRFYDSCRVLPMGDEEPNDLHRARLTLVDATRVVLANGLALLGVSAPERMSAPQAATIVQRTTSQPIVAPRSGWG